jgi:hypothetical protein
VSVFPSNYQVVRKAIINVKERTDWRRAIKRPRRTCPIFCFSPGADIGPMDHFDPKRTVGLIASLPASGLESGSADTAIIFQALLAERQMARAPSIFVVYR